MTDTVTIQSSNLWSGTFGEDYFWVLGGANNGGHEDYDTNSGNEAFVFGNLQHQSATITDTSYDDGSMTDSGTEQNGGTWQITASGTSGDTLHFTFTSGSESTSFFDSTQWAGLNTSPPDFTGDGDFTYEATGSSANLQGAYDAWVASLDPSSTFSNSTQIEYNENPSGNEVGQDTGAETNYLTLDTTANLPGGLTTEYGGEKVLLGFSLGSDHIALDGVTSESVFDQFFTVTSTTHTSANGNTVNDTTISLDGSDWSVVLYGIDSTANTTESELQSFAWNNIIQTA